MSINFSPTIKINHVYQYKHPPMHYSRLSARKKQQKRESFSTHLQSSTGKKWGGGGSSINICFQRQSQGKPEKEVPANFFPRSQGNPSKKTKQHYVTHSPQNVHTPFFM